MSGSIVAAAARTAAAMAAAALLAGCDASQTTGAASAQPVAGEAPARHDERPRRAAERPRGAIEDCSTRSEASFSGVYDDRDHVVVGPLVLVGAAYTSPDVVREFGGDKIMALVRPGHRVTVALPRRVRSWARLGYGPLPQGVELAPRDGHRVVTFVSCRPGEPSGSTADGWPVTFWSGFVLASAPGCVPITVWIDRLPRPRRALLRMGVRRCP
jgi:hypothetical protein